MAAAPPDLFLASDDDDQRLMMFREKHPPPGVIIRPGQFGTWEALAPGLLGDGVVVRHTLRELLDRLGEMLGPGG